MASVVNIAERGRIFTASARFAISGNGSTLCALDVPAGTIARVTNRYVATTGGLNMDILTFADGVDFSGATEMRHDALNAVDSRDRRVTAYRGASGQGAETVLEQTLIPSEEGSGPPRAVGAIQTESLYRILDGALRTRVLRIVNRDSSERTVSLQWVWMESSE